MKAIPFLFLLLTCRTINAQSGIGSITGWVMDDSTKTGIPFVNIAIFKDGQLVSGTATEMDGLFHIKNINSGQGYTLKASNINYVTVQLQDVCFKADSSTIVEIKLGTSRDSKLDTTILNHFDPHFVSEQFGDHIYFRNVERSKPCDGVRNVDGMIGSIQGSRDGPIKNLIDGVNIRGSSTLPTASCLDSLNFDSLNGTPAQFEINPSPKDSILIRVPISE